ncbi:MAG: type IV pilin protein [Candidatus Omnitrophota bacterium]
MSRRAVTLVELLIVVIIIGLLASVGMVQYRGVVEKGRAAEAYSVLSEIVHAEKAYYIENDAYTATLTNLDRFTAVPVSDNFTYSIPSANVNRGYAQAARRTGNNSYGMCLKSGERATCANRSTCNPGCS